MTNKSKSWWVYCATLGDVGYAPAPGTIASAIMLPVIYALQYYQVSLIHYALLIAGVAIFSYVAIQKSLPFFNQKDPSPIVLDECLGMLITLFGVAASGLGPIVGFLLFRLFDISKIFGISQCEKLPGAWGVLCDDVAAAVLANIILRFLVPLVCS